MLPVILMYISLYFAIEIFKNQYNSISYENQFSDMVENQLAFTYLLNAQTFMHMYMLPFTLKTCHCVTRLAMKNSNRQTILFPRGTVRVSGGLFSVVFTSSFLKNKLKGLCLYFLLLYTIYRLSATTRWLSYPPLLLEPHTPYFPILLSPTILCFIYFNWILLFGIYIIMTI